MFLGMCVFKVCVCVLVYVCVYVYVGVFMFLVLLCVWWCVFDPNSE